MQTMDPELTIDFTLTEHFKGFPRGHAPVLASEVGALGWNILAGDLPLPLAVIKREALEHNLAWMQAQVRAWGVALAPHGKTSMSPQLFRRQLDAGAWGITFATVHQVAVGVVAGVRRALIANQVVADADLAGIQYLLRDHEDLRIVFLVDSLAQLILIDTWFAAHPQSLTFEVMLEIGVDGGRTGCRGDAEAKALAQQLHSSAAVRFVGIECYEGLNIQGNTEHDASCVKALMDRAQALAQWADAEQLFDASEVLFSAGGSAVFDLVAARLRPGLSKPVLGLLRSGCYVTHDHGHYKRLVSAVNARCGCAEREGLQSALEVWAHVQSQPEPGLAILAVGRRDISFDVTMPIPFARAQRGALTTGAVPSSWHITGLNDQHAYLRWDSADNTAAPVVGERIGLGISHPCTTFDKWHWMPVVEDDYRVSSAVAMHF